MRDDESPLAFHDFLGQPVRRGNWRDHCTSTYDLCSEAIRDGLWEDARILARHTIDEAREPVALYTDWIPAIRDYLSEKGVPAAAVAADEELVLATIRRRNTVAFDPQEGWSRVCALVDETDRLCQAHRSADALTALETSRTVWLDTHDRLCDWLQGMIAIAARRIGEDCIGDLWDRLMTPMFDSYERFDVDRTPWEISSESLLQVTAEALRGHLSGTDRRGTLEFVEDDDRIGFRFRPCGSGGRNYTGGTFDTYPRTTEHHDWAWNLKGVCLYCAHCCALSERNPIQRFGYPARVVEPPFEDGDESRAYCTWWVYRDPRRIPEEVYRRTGNRKPVEIGGAATRAAKASPGRDAN